MQAVQNSVVSIDYKLTDDSGEVLDTSENNGALSFILGRGEIIPGLEKEIDGKKVGDEFSAKVLAAEAYGEYQESLVQDVPKKQFPEGTSIEVGSEFASGDDQGNQFIVRVVNVEEDVVTVDGNHPLAGMDLTFEVKILEVRAATEEELSHGHVHEESTCCSGGECDNSSDDKNNGCCGGDCK